MKIITEYSSTTHVDIIEIKSAVYVGDFVICIDFSDGINQNIDFKPFLNQSLHPSIRQYLHEDKFQKFTIEDGNLHWNNYELIFPLEELHSGRIIT